MLVHKLFRSFRAVLWNRPPYAESTEGPKKGADHSTLVGDRVKKQWNLQTRLVSGSQMVSWSLHCPVRILKVYGEAWTRFHHVSCPDGLNTTLSSQSCVLGPNSGSKEGKWTHIPRAREGVRSLPLLGSGSWANPSHVFSMTFPNSLC